jgi:hypothetical protein
MIVNFYSKDFVALQNNASLNVGNWELKRKAVDFDDFSLTSEAFVQDVNPCFIIMKDDFGRYKYGAFAGIPQLNKDNQTDLQASDLKTIFKNKILLKLGTYSYLDEMLSDVFTAFNTQVMQGSFSLEVDLTDLSTIAMGDLIPLTDLTVYDVWEDILVPYMKYYNCYIDSYLDEKNQKLVFTIKRTNKNTLSLKLWELGIKNYGKWISSLNEVQCVVSLDEALTYGDKYLLLSDNSITTATNSRDLYPIKNEIVLKETSDSSEIAKLLTEGSIEAIEKLVEARYNESIEFGTSNIQSYENAYFDTNFDVYVKKGIKYKTLPLGEIYEKYNSENKTYEKKLKVGYKQDDLAFYL